MGRTVATLGNGGRDLRPDLSLCAKTAYARLAACLALLLGAYVSAGAMAETLYRSTDSSGRVSYSDQPLQGAAKVERVVVEPLDPENAARMEAAREKSRRETEEFQQRERERERALDEAHADVVKAINALRDAQRRREAGVEPLPGERFGNTRGGTRLAPSYFARQQALDLEVSAAQQRLEQAYARRNDVR
jgi:hypothetical protein